MADMIICKGCNKERYSNDDFTIDNAREDVLDDGNVLCNYCWIAHDDYVEAESFEADEWNNDEYVDLAKRVPKRFKEDNLQDAYVEGFLDCLYNQTGGITDEVYDDDFDAESFEADEWNNDEYVDLAKRVPKRFKEDNLQDAYVEGFLDCLYNQTGGITDEVYDDDFDAESFEADEWNNDEYVDLAKRVPKRFKEDNLQDAYVEGFLDCLYNQTGGITDEVYDDDFDAESFEAQYFRGKEGYFIGSEKERKALGKRIIIESEDLKEFGEPDWKYIEKAGKALVKGDFNVLRHNMQMLDSVPSRLMTDAFGSDFEKVISPKKIEQLHLYLDAESFEAEVCPCGCAMVGCVCSPSCKGECLGAESFEADMTVGDGFKLGVGAILGFTAIGAAFGLLGNLIGNLIGNKGE